MVLLAALLASLETPKELVLHKEPEAVVVAANPFVSQIGSQAQVPANRLVVSKLAEAKPWLNRYTVALSKAALGDTVVFEAYLRSPDRHSVEIHVGDTIGATLILTPDWQLYRLVGVVGRMGNDWSANIWLGTSSGEVDVAKLSVTDHDREPASSINELRGGDFASPDTGAWRASALKRIDKFRKGPLTVKVVDAKGAAVVGATIRLDETRPQFRFGTSISAGDIVGTDSDSTRMREEILKRFNTVTFENELKWRTGSRTGASPLRRVKACLPWLEKNQIEIHGHTLVWGSFQYSSPSLAGKSKEEMRSQIESHILDYVTQMGDHVYVWDVVNEAIWEHDLWDVVGWDEFPRAFALAKQANPHVLLSYNDFPQHRDEEPQGYKSWLTRIKQITGAGAPLDILGDQCHMEQPFIPLSRMVSRWQEMAKLGKRIEITEMDVSTPNEQLQARYLRDFVTGAFSVPEVDGIILWGFFEGRMWKPKGALFRRDWKPKPALKAFDDLVLGQFRTHKDLVSSRKGVASTRAFFGTYHVAVSLGNQTAEATVEHVGNDDVTVHLP